MPVNALHHYTIRCAPDDLPELVDFYTRVMRLEVGARPEIPAPGAWLYAGGQPIVHLYANQDQRDARRDTIRHVDHISFRSHGLREMREHLSAAGVPYTEAPIPGWDLHQVFVQDPHGMKIEMTFWLSEEKDLPKEGA